MGICHSNDSLNKFKKYSYSSSEYENDISLNIINKEDKNKITKLDIAIWENTVPGTTRRSSSFLVKINKI
jgi:hypothetical protein